MGWGWHLCKRVALSLPLLARAEWLTAASPFVQLSRKGGTFSLPFLPLLICVSKPAF